MFRYLCAVITLIAFVPLAEARGRPTFARCSNSLGFSAGVSSFSFSSVATPVVFSTPSAFTFSSPIVTFATAAPNTVVFAAPPVVFAQRGNFRLRAVGVGQRQRVNIRIGDRVTPLRNAIRNVFGRR